MSGKTPSVSELTATAKTALNVLKKMNHEKIAGSLVEVSKDYRKYNGRSYLEDYPKGSSTNKSETPNDFSGIYVFYDRNKPAYVGISNTIIRRLRQHLFGKLHNQATLAYLIAMDRLEKSTGEEYIGLREDSPFPKYRETIQHEIQDKWEFAVYPMKGGYQLAFSEIYIAAALKAKWNSFDTH